MTLASCATQAPYYGAPVTEIGSAVPPAPSGQSGVGPDPGPERISFGRSGLTLSPSRGDHPVARGILTFSSTHVTPAELLRIVAGALDLTTVLLDKPPETPELDVPQHIPVADALNLLDNVLAGAGEEMSFGDSVIYVRNSSGVGDIRLARTAVHAIRLNFIDNQTFASLAASMIPRDRLILPQSDPSLVIYVGPARGVGSLASIRELTDAFDLRGTEATILRLRRGDPEEIARQVKDAIGGGQNGFPRIIPLVRRRALLVVAPRGFNVSSVMQLVSSLQAETEDEAVPIHVFTPQYRTAADLVALLNSMGSRPQQSQQPQENRGSGAGARVGSTTIGDAAGRSQADLGVSPGQSPDGGGSAANPLLSSAPLVSAPATAPAPPASGDPGSDQMTLLQGLLRQTNVDPQTNRIFFSGSASDFALLRRALVSLDSGGGQVMIEALIMQVLLNDQLQYGVQYALTNAKIFGTPISLTDNASVAATEGLVFNFGQSSAQVIVHALDEVTNVSVISSPKILVVSGETARFHFGSSVPVLSASLTTSQGSGAAIANQIDYRDTGVSLLVTPSSINDTMADLSIQQVLSNISNTPVSGVNSPTFDDRQINTHVRLKFGDTIMLGGIIEHDRNDTDTGIPLLRRIPVIGSLFGLTNRGGARSEYVLLLTPRLYLDSSGGPRIEDATNLRFEELQRMWNNLHVGEGFPTASVDRLRQLGGP